MHFRKKKFTTRPSVFLFFNSWKMNSMLNLHFNWFSSLIYLISQMQIACAKLLYTAFTFPLQCAIKSVFHLKPYIYYLQCHLKE